MNEEKKENLTENSQVDPVEDLVEEIKEEQKQEEVKSDVVLEPVPSEATVEVDQSVAKTEESQPAVETPVEAAPAVEEAPAVETPVVEETPAVEPVVAEASATTETPVAEEPAPEAPAVPAETTTTPDATPEPTTETTQPEAKKKSMLPLLLVVIVILAVVAVVFVVKPFDKKESTTKGEQSGENKETPAKPVETDPSTSAEATAKATVEAYSTKNSKKLVALLHPDYKKAMETELAGSSTNGQSMTAEQIYDMMFALMDSITFAENPTVTELNATEIATLKTELETQKVSLEIAAATKYTYNVSMSAMGTQNAGTMDVIVMKVADKWYLCKFSEEVS